MSIKIIIGGDICPTKNNINSFIQSETKKIFGDVLPELLSSDYVIANLETPLIKRKSPIEKTGANFGVNPDILKVLEKANINFLNLSNNHILDHGIQGLKTTISSLEKSKIDSSGAGMDIETASKPFSKNIKGKKISIMSYSEHEFNIASDSQGGANPLDLMDFISRINSIKKISDLVILLFSGGREHYALPTPNQQKLCRFFVSQGVDIVVCQHSHIGGAYEVLDKKLIVYGQGNFLFDPTPLNPKTKDWYYKGYLLNIDLKEKYKFNFQFIPIVSNSFFDPGLIGINKMNDIEGEKYLNKIQSLNYKMIHDEDFIKREWILHCKKYKKLYLSILKGHGRVSRKINQFLPFLDFAYSNDKKLLLQNIIRCQTHREITETILKL